MPDVAALAARVGERVHEAVLEARTDVGDDVLVVVAQHLQDVCRVLRDEEGFDLLSDVSGVDWQPRDPRFDVNVHLYSVEHNRRLRVKVQVGGDEPHVPSLTALFPGANYHEREVYDFFGIVFDGHPALTRLFMPEEWVGHPLRKDYPVGGVPVEYKIEPAYVGDRVVSDRGRPAAGGLPGRIHADRGRRSPWTWSGPPATGVRIDPPRRKEPDAEGDA